MWPGVLAHSRSRYCGCLPTDSIIAHLTIACQVFSCEFWSSRKNSFPHCRACRALRTGQARTPQARATAASAAAWPRLYSSLLAPAASEASATAARMHRTSSLLFRSRLTPLPSSCSHARTAPATRTTRATYPWGVARPSAQAKKRQETPIPRPRGAHPSRQASARRILVTPPPTWGAPFAQPSPHLAVGPADATAQGQRHSGQRRRVAGRRHSPQDVCHVLTAPQIKAHAPTSHVFHQAPPAVRVRALRAPRPGRNATRTRQDRGAAYPAAARITAGSAVSSQPVRSSAPRHRAYPAAMSLSRQSW